MMVTRRSPAAARVNSETTTTGGGLDDAVDDLLERVTVERRPTLTDLTTSDAAYTAEDAARDDARDAWDSVAAAVPVSLDQAPVQLPAGQQLAATSTVSQLIITMAQIN